MAAGDNILGIVNNYKLQPKTQNLFTMEFDFVPGSNTGTGVNMPPNPFERVFRLMKLDSTQRVAVIGYLKAARDCERAGFLKLKALMEPIVKAANEQRRDILSKLAKKEITRTEAAAQLKALNLSTRTLLETDAAIVAAKAEIKACFTKLLADIEAILTADQLVIWKRYLATIKK